MRSCTELKKLKTDKACPKFKADPNHIRDIIQEEETGDLMAEIASFVSQLGTTQLKTFAGALLNEAVTRKMGMYMWQPVYIRYRGTVRANYMSNFMTARILNADKNMVRIISDDGKIILRISAYDNLEKLNGPTVYSRKNFEALREEMVEKGREVDPTLRTTQNIKAVELEDITDPAMPRSSRNGQIASIDQVARTNKVSRKGKRREDDVMDLTDIARSLENGTADFAGMTSDQVVAFKETSYPKRKKSQNGMTEYEAGDLI